MKRLFFIVILLGIVVFSGFLTSCARQVVLSPANSQKFQFVDFSSVSIKNTSEKFSIGDPVKIPVEVDITRSNVYQVEIIANQNIFQYIDVSKDRNTLNIVIDRKKIGTSQATLGIKIALPVLSGLTLDKGIFNAEVFSAESGFEAAVLGGSFANINMQTGQSSLKVDSDSDVILRGSANDFNALVLGGSTLDMDIQAENVVMRVDSSSHVTERGVSRSYNGTVSGGSYLNIDIQSGTSKFKIDSSSKVTINGTTGNLDANVMGGSTLNISLHSGDVTFQEDSSSNITGQLVAGMFQADLKGGSRMELQGSGTQALLRSSGSSKLELEKFMLQDTQVTLEGGSKGNVNVNGKLDVNLDSSANLFYTGNSTLGSVFVTEGSHLNRK